MKMYDVEGTYKGREVKVAVVDSEYPDKVKVELWHPKKGEIPLGEDHYDKTVEFFAHKNDYLRLLFRKRDARVARKYIMDAGLVIKRVVC